jgi:hypothetical protein
MNLEKKRPEATQREGGMHDMHCMHSMDKVHFCTMYTTMRILVSKNGGKMRSCSRFLLLKIVTMSTVQA